jgi:hypothetical protein
LKKKILKLKDDELIWGKNEATENYIEKLGYTNRMKEEDEGENKCCGSFYGK